VNDPFVIASHDRMVAINSALQVDLTGQVCADSIGSRFFSGIGGQVDFMRGARRSRGGRPIIAMRSTAMGGSVSRIVPVLSEGAGVVTTRGDVHYVVTEYGVASLHGRTVRERVLALLSIAHPDFRGELFAAAKERRFVSPNQLELPPHGLPYPSDCVSTACLRDGRPVLYRPLRPDDERALRDFFYSHSDETVYLRYGTPLKRLSPAQVQRFVTLDYDGRMAIGAFLVEEKGERAGDEGIMIGVGRYDLDRATDLAECAFTVHDDFQNLGIGSTLLKMLMQVARSRHIEGFTAQVLTQNVRMMHVFRKHSMPLTTTISDGVYRVCFRFAEIDRARRESERQQTPRTRSEDAPSPSPPLR
jgi:RimJ/RimL family protein N-acetyltransferase